MMLKIALAILMVAFLYAQLSDQMNISSDRDDDVVLENDWKSCKVNSITFSKLARLCAAMDNLFFFSFKCVE